MEIKMLEVEQYGKIIYYKNAIENVSDLLNLIEKTDLDDLNLSVVSKWNNWISSDKSYTFGKQKMMNFNNYDNSSNETKLIYDSINNPIVFVSKHYSEMFNFDIGKLMPLSISKYFVGKEMGPHVDSYGDDRSPVISVVAYLNDDYEGGELYFNKQGIKIKPEAGSIMVFPSTEPYYHESMPIKNGVKYMSPGFWYKT
jgi:predicted 2-oxoglutarate/Fe(II)-dependent dioxygenase YbiX